MIISSGLDSSVGKATRYGLDGLGIESRWGGDFLLPSRRHWGPPSLPYNGYRVFPGVKRPECGVDHPPPSCGEVEGRVELYICSSSRPSWPDLGRSLLYLYIWQLAVFTECEWTVNEAKGMCAGMMQTKDRKIWQWCGYSIYRIYHWTLNSPIEWTWEHYIVLYVSFIGVVKTTLLTGFPGEYRISVRLNICVWCGAGRERENNLLQHNMILNIFCNSCLGISSTVRPFCVFFFINVLFAPSTQAVFVWRRIGWRKRPKSSNDLFVPQKCCVRQPLKYEPYGKLRCLHRRNRIHSPYYFNLQKIVTVCPLYDPECNVSENIWVSLSPWRRFRYHVTTSRMLHITRLFTNQYLLFEVFVWLTVISYVKQVSNGSTTTSRCSTKPVTKPYCHNNDFLGYAYERAAV